MSARDKRRTERNMHERTWKQSNNNTTREDTGKGNNYKNWLCKYLTFLPHKNDQRYICQSLKQTTVTSVKYGKFGAAIKTTNGVNSAVRRTFSACNQPQTVVSEYRKGDGNNYASIRRRSTPIRRDLTTFDLIDGESQSNRGRNRSCNHRLTHT